MTEESKDENIKVPNGPYVPVLSFDVHDYPFGTHFAPLDRPEHRAFIKKYKLENGSRFWVSNGELRYLVTLDTNSNPPRIRIHWGMCQTVVVDGDSN